MTIPAHPGHVHADEETTGAASAWLGFLALRHQASRLGSTERDGGRLLVTSDMPIWRGAKEQLRQPAETREGLAYVVCGARRNPEPVRMALGQVE